MKAITMAHPHHHALSSVKKWGGDVADYIALHDFFDQSKSHMADVRHRAFRHHSLGIFQLEERFGKTITLSTGRVIPTRWVGEQHVKEDLGCIPSLADWLRCIRPQPWMSRSRKLSIELAPGNSDNSDTFGEATPAPASDNGDVALMRAHAALDAYAACQLRAPDISIEGLAAVVADLFHLAAVNGAEDSAILGLIDLARQYHRTEHGNQAA